MNSETGKYIVIIGVVVVVAGVIIWLFHDKLNWLGRMPGDIRVERENFRFYFPITTMIVISVVVTGILYLIRKL
ncbi:MAG: DUF2905 domain-containing protein [Chitinophagaceae bacterium]|nr:DUF2905 domain-containing protein [Chitinophagaceae bacterium]